LSTRRHPFVNAFSTSPGIKAGRSQKFSNNFLGILDILYNYLYIPSMVEKPIFWIASSLDDVRSFPEDARRLAGHFLHIV
jgi:hypothetical protein